ncbi:hypothetical protein [Dysgonomonas sp. HGC4]|uniref:hypothetical protein n=2 Tax=Dysgonomonas sp. HGC4 TaxID=1658009 RepID=UPI000B278846|nr:hypothetical protein [Dysgonomonas sp. HGC4]MBD8347531.1 hypothetical protein [Dysgonomonas sp. HGC4]
MIKNRNTMKITSLLIIISCIALLFTSCEKDEMGIGTTGGGGMDNSVESTSSRSGLQLLDLNGDLGQVSVNITNTNEEVVFYKEVDTSLDENTSIDISSLPSDIYYIDIVGKDGEIIEHDSFIIK